MLSITQNMITFSTLAAVILSLISVLGVITNIYVFYKLFRRKGQFSGFHKLCIVKTIPNTIVCLAFLLWSTPLCLLPIKYSSIPRNLNVSIGQVAGWGAYILGPYLQVCMSVNRFHALYFPIQSMKITRVPLTNIAILFGFCIATIYTIIGLPAECGFVFDPDGLSWRPEYFDCAVWLSDFIFYSILILSITSNSLNFASFLKLVHSSVNGASFGNNNYRRKRNRNMFIQSFTQDCLHLFDMINCTIIYKLNSEIWFTFIFLSVSFLGIHAIDGFVMLLFHSEIHPKWLQNFYVRKSSTIVLFPTRSKTLSNAGLSRN